MVDTSHVAYVSYYGIPIKTIKTKTEIVYRMFRRVHQLLMEYGSANIVFFWDSKKSIRKDKFPFYKDTRRVKQKKDPDLHLLYEALEEFLEMLPACGFINHVEEEGFESDDTMAAMVIHNPNRPFVIVASDGDLFQLFKYKNLRHFFSCRDNTKFSIIDFKNKHSIDPLDWHLYKAIAGCTSDNVPGVTGVGDVICTKFLLGIKIPEKAMEAIVNGIDIIVRNLWLVTIPLNSGHKLWDKYKDYPIHKFKLDLKSMEIVFKEHGYTFPLHEWGRLRWTHT